MLNIPYKNGLNARILNFIFMKSKIIIVFFLWSAFLNAHVGIYTANQHLPAALDIQSGLTYQGVLLLHISTSTIACTKGLKICK